MKAMPQAWTDDRMDDLAAKVDTGFAQARVDLGATREELRREIKEQGAELRSEIHALEGKLRHELDARFYSVDRRFDSIDARLDSLYGTIAAGQRTMLQICGGLCAALIAAVATLIASVA